MTRNDIKALMQEAGLKAPAKGDFIFIHWDQIALLIQHERERICKAIEEEDDYCVDEGDYMLDSDNCIAVARGEWVRPDYSVNEKGKK